MLFSEREGSEFEEVLAQPHMLNLIGYFGLCLGDIVELLGAQSETESEISVIH